MSFTPATPHSSFKLVRQQVVASLNIEVQEYEHKVTGAQHFHLSAASDENVFLVALRTVPKDSSGVAHILEHTALCGSEKFPVRDPFFMMTRRSLNTFMNAFTSSDWTAYPFASLNRKDFNNLLDVYLDAVFFSRLDQLDFAQEGHRLEFAEDGNPDSPLVYKGVVYNEMKGAMSSVPSQLWHTLSKHLFPTTTYHYNSGGDPDDIPDLSYQELLQFYRTHYHPSNAIFMTYGEISASEHQQKFEQQALHRFEKLDYTVAVGNEKRYHAPMRVQEAYPYNDDDAEHKSHVVMAWLLGKSTDLGDSLRAQLLSSVLLDNSATPLMHALESSELGNGPSPLCGLDDSQLELTFVCGLEGTERQSADEIEKLIFDTLKKVAEEGVPQEDIESALHQLELHQREVGGDSYPYGLQLILTSLTAATHRGDPVGLLDIDAALEQLREDIKDPEFIKKLAQDLLLDNPHRVRLMLQPDSKMAARKERAEVARLAAKKAALSEQEKTAIIEQAAALKLRQDQIDDESILPKVTLADVPSDEVHQEPSYRATGDTPLTSYGVGTNGLLYQQVIYPLPELSDTQTALLPIYTGCLTELGAGEHGYLDMQRWQARVTGGVSAFTSVRGATDDVHSLSGFITYSGKALNRNQAALTDLMKTLIDAARFDETGRLLELIGQMRAHREQSVTGSGHVLAMLAATSGLCASALLSHKLNGLAGIRALKELDSDIKQGKGLDELSSNLHSLHQHLTAAPHQLLLVAEPTQLDAFQTNLSTKLNNAKRVKDVSRFDLAKHQEIVNDAWLTNSQVNFCARAFPTVPSGHPDAAALIVLGGFLRNGFLHKAVREQGGAYGGGASQDNNSGSFRFYSYRDPRMGETLQDFDRAIDWLLSSKHDAQKVEEAILGTVSSLDRSESPAGRAKRIFHAELHGRTQEVRQHFRERVLATTLSDLHRVADTYLRSENACTAIVTDFSQKDAVLKLGLNPINL